jgi:hypothetical protein
MVTGWAAMSVVVIPSEVHCSPGRQGRAGQGRAEGYEGGWCGGWVRGVESVEARERSRCQRLATRTLLLSTVWYERFVTRESRDLQKGTAEVAPVASG